MAVTISMTNRLSTRLVASCAKRTLTPVSSSTPTTIPAAAVAKTIIRADFAPFSSACRMSRTPMRVPRRRFERTIAYITMRAYGTPVYWLMMKAIDPITGGMMTPPVEAAASTGGVIMPPVMGSIAFIMSQYTGVPYARIVLYAIVPALLCFFGIFLAVHWSALRHDVAGISPAELPSWRRAIVERGHLFLPLVLLVVLIARGYTPQFAVFYSTIAVIVLANLRRGTRMGVRDILQALENGAKSALMIVLATAAAGMVVGVLELTGVSVRFAQEATSLVDNLLVMLIVTAIVSIALGLGLPPSASYIVQVAVTIPALIAFLTLGGMDPQTALIVTHFFVMYYAALAVLTPPDALAAVAAAGIAGSDFMRTAVTGTRIAFAAFIVPFMAVYRPGLLLLGPVSGMVTAVLVAAAAVFVLSMALEGHFLRPLSPAPRLLMFGAGAALVAPIFALNAVGAAVAAGLCLQQRWQVRADGGSPAATVAADHESIGP